MSCLSFCFINEFKTKWSNHNRKIWFSISQKRHELDKHVIHWVLFGGDTVIAAGYIFAFLICRTTSDALLTFIDIYRRESVFQQFTKASSILFDSITKALFHFHIVFKAIWAYNRHRINVQALITTRCITTHLCFYITCNKFTLINVITEASLFIFIISSRAISESSNFRIKIQNDKNRTEIMKLN